MNNIKMETFFGWNVRFAIIKVRYLLQWELENYGTESVFNVVTSKNNSGYYAANQYYKTKD